MNKLQNELFIEVANSDNDLGSALQDHIDANTEKFSSLVRAMIANSEGWNEQQKVLFAVASAEMADFFEAAILKEAQHRENAFFARAA